MKQRRPEEELTLDRKERLGWLDILKCIGMYLVVIAHAEEGFEADWRLVIYSFHMPMFFIISGMGCYLQLSKRTYTFEAFVKNKLKTLILPYFVFSFLALPIHRLNFSILSDEKTTVSELIFGIFYSHQKMVTSTTNAMWFVPALFLTLIVFYAIRRWARGNQNNLIFMVLIIGAFGCVMSAQKDDFYMPWHVETVPIALMCVLAGYLFIQHQAVLIQFISNRKIGPAAFIVFVLIGFYFAKFNSKPVVMMSDQYGQFFMAAGSTICFTAACIILAVYLPELRIFKFIGRNTMVILAFHAPCFRFLERVSEITASLIAEHPIFVGTCVFVALLPVCWVVERFFPFLLGRKRR